MDDYIHKLIDYCNFHVSCASRVKETNQIFTSQDSFCLAKPELKIEVRKITFVDNDMSPLCNYDYINQPERNFEFRQI